ncbi:AI-2E family transporter [Desulfovibrio psychrotolerans]|uniref:AI-2E family transporter n=1 Tax=Desulfovibrio psychrotolerans TaxID=415242 RepID=A0A7J0BSG1_9BACT|nr:AI-2E family transporter [Desulfovibrio psychrotolerans]GFM36112.1 AI-2E family transporter [Desulfovibrio psychrotolerans]
MVISDKPFTFDRVIRIAITVGLLWGIVTVLGYLSDVLVPFVVALILAYLAHPLVMAVETRIRNRQAAVLLSLAIIVFAISTLFSFVMPYIMAEVKHMGRLITAFATNSDLAAKASRQLPEEVWIVLRDALTQSDLREFFTSSQGLDMVQTMAKKVLPGLWGAVKGARDIILAITGLLIIVLYTVFLLLDFRKVQENWQSMLPVTWREPVALFVRDFEAGMNRYFRAQALVAGIVGVLFAIAFSLMGLPMGIMLGLFIGLLNMVPYLQILGFIPAVMLGVVHWLETDMSLSLVMGLILAIFAVVQLIQDAVLVPRVMGKAMGLSPWMILLSLSVWGKLLGLLGLLIALPMTVLCLSYYRRIIEPVPPGTAGPITPDAAKPSPPVQNTSDKAPADETPLQPDTAETPAEAHKNAPPATEQNNNAKER